MHRYQLEKYIPKQLTRYTCPRCGTRKSFTRYIDTETGMYLGEDVGRCNRQTNCGYHRTPREHFFFHPEDWTPSLWYPQIPVADKKPLPSFSRIPATFVHESRERPQDNAFLTFLGSAIGAQGRDEVSNRYCVGTWRDGRTVFWQIDENFEVRTGKLIRYDPLSGKRSKTQSINWAHRYLDHMPGDLPGTSFELVQCLFGQHLLAEPSRSPVGVVESEKTAVIASFVWPELVWVSTGGSNNLRLLANAPIPATRTVILFPDSSQYQKWSIRVEELFGKTSNVQVSDLLETELSDVEKKTDVDIADLILDTLQIWSPRLKRRYW